MANLSNINNKFLVTTGGNVLIGQTSAVGSSILQVTGSSTFTPISTVSFIVTNSGNALRLISGVPSGVTWIGKPVEYYASEYSFSTDVTGVGGYSQQFVIENNGDVGIGTSSPDVKIHAVASGTKIGPLGGTVLGVQNNSSTSTNCWISALAGNAGAAALVLGDADDNDQARFQFNNSGRLLQMLNAGVGITIDTSGKVGIRTDSPNSFLHVGSTGTNAYSSTITKGSNMKGIMNTLSNNADDMVGIYFATGSTTEGDHWSGITGSRSDSASHWGTQLNFYTHNNDVANLNDATQKMVIKGDGNVGIGTNSPLSKLQIQANQHATNPGAKNYTGSAINADGGDIATGKLFLQGYQNTANDLCGFNNEADRVVLYNYTDARYLQLWNHTGDTFIPNGNVGIGTTSPLKLLTVKKATSTTTIATSEVMRLAGTAQAVGNKNELGFANYDNDYNASVVIGAEIMSTLAYLKQDLYFATRDSTSDIAPTERMRIDSAGTVTIPGVIESGGGIKLGGTATVNKLDDYEEGTWTPTVKGDSVAGTATYGAQGGSYTKIGNKVTCWFSIMNFTQSGASGAFTVASLPFTCITTSAVRGCFAGNLRFYNMDFPDGYDVPSINLEDNTVQFYILWSRDNGTWANQVVKNGGNQYIEGYVTYSTA